MQRIPEPELMNDAAQALAYAQADFSEPHLKFIELFAEKFPDLIMDDVVLDIGCGPADISRRFAQAYPACRIHGIDGAPRMLELGDASNQQAGLTKRIELFEICLPTELLPLRSYKTIISNSLLHHLHDPLVLWRTIQQYAVPGTAIFIMDLQRPPSQDHARDIVVRFAASEPEILQADFYASLCAAFTPDEVRKQLHAVNLSELAVDNAGERHMIIYGTAI